MHTQNRLLHHLPQGQLPRHLKKKSRTRKRDLTLEESLHIVRRNTPPNNLPIEFFPVFVSDRKDSERFYVQSEFANSAHRSLPFGTRVRVTDLATNRSVVVVITDRGPSVRDRVLDLSLGAARTLGMTDRGVAQVRAEVL